MTIDCLDRVREIAERIPDQARRRRSVSAAKIPIRRRFAAPFFGTTLPYQPPLSPRSNLSALPVPDHPVYIMYSSGTTGLPKCMVHGAGGTLLQHLEGADCCTPISRATTADVLLHDLRLDDVELARRSSLAVGVDAHPLRWRAARHTKPIAALGHGGRASASPVFGTSAKWLALAEKEGVQPIETHDLCIAAGLSSRQEARSPHTALTTCMRT